MNARVGAVVLLSRRADEPMVPRAMITLGTGELRWLPEPTPSTAAWPAPTIAPPALAPAPPAPTAAPPALASEPVPDLNDLADRVACRLAEALSPGIVHVAGSRRMGCALPAADLDLVAALPDIGTDVAARVRAALPEAVRLRQVIGARVPGLRLRVSDLDVDLTVVTTGQIPPAQLLSRRAELGEAAAIALSAVSDADAIRTAVGPAPRRVSPVSPAR